MYRKTKGGLWRKVDGGGSWFKHDSARPDTLVSSVWEKIRRSEKNGVSKQQLALMEMEKLVEKHPDLLESTKDPETRELLEKKRVAEIRRAAHVERKKKERKLQAKSLIEMKPKEKDAKCS